MSVESITVNNVVKAYYLDLSDVQGTFSGRITEKDFKEMYPNAAAISCYIECPEPNSVCVRLNC